MDMGLRGSWADAGERKLWVTRELCVERFEEAAGSFSRTAAPSHILPAVLTCSHFSISSLALVIVDPSYFSPSRGCEPESHCDFSLFPWQLMMPNIFLWAYWSVIYHSGANVCPNLLSILRSSDF